MTATRSDGVRRDTLPAARVKDLTDALRLAARLNASDKASELSPIAGALAAEIMGSVRPFGAVDLEVRVAVAGSTADGTVTVYHCEGSSAAAAEFKELASRKVTVGDRFDWVLARQPQFASSSRDLARLTAALVAAALIAGTGAIAALAPIDARLGLVGLTPGNPRWR